VLLPDKAAYYLSFYMANRKKYDPQIVFPTRYRGNLKPIFWPSVFRMLRKFAKEAGMRGRVHPHGFRHNGITWWLDAGIDLEVVSRGAFSPDSIERLIRLRATI